MIQSLIYIFSNKLDFAAFQLPDYSRVAGSVVMFLNMIFFLWIHIFLGNNWSSIIELNKEHTLITSVPYKYIRHQMYTSIFIYCIALWILTANHIVGLSARISFGIIYPFRVKTEEQMMQDEFGEEYKKSYETDGEITT